MAVVDNLEALLAKGTDNACCAGQDARMPRAAEEKGDVLAAKEMRFF